MQCQQPLFLVYSPGLVSPNPEPVLMEYPGIKISCWMITSLADVVLCLLWCVTPYPNGLRVTRTWKYRTPIVHFRLLECRTPIVHSALACCLTRRNDFSPKL